MRISQITSRNIVCTDIHESLKSAAVQLSSNEVGALLVYDSRGPIGIIGERDLAQAIADGADLQQTRVRDYMTVAPVRIGGGDSLEEGIAKMSDLGVRHLAVTEGEEIVGMISARDILKALSKRRTLSASKVTVRQ